MKPNEMHRLGHAGCHQCAPRGWHDVPIVTNDYDLDATILHRNNKDLAHRLELYTRRGASSAYGPVSGYSGYHNYRGDS